MVSVREVAVVTSGSFKRESSRWPRDVKGRPVKPVRSTFDEVRAMTWRLIDRKSRFDTLERPILTLSLITAAASVCCRRLVNSPG